VLLFVFFLCVSLAWIVAMAHEGARNEQELQQMISDFDDRWGGMIIMGQDSPKIWEIVDTEEAKITKFCEDHKFTLWLNSLLDPDAMYPRWVERNEF
jgi:hypothetical protein